MKYSFIATIAVCGTLATGACFAQTMPATPTNPHPVQTAVPPTTPQPTEQSPTLPAAPSTAGVVPQQPQLQRQQQELRNGVKSTTDQGMHPRAGETHNGTETPSHPASASSTR